MKNYTLASCLALSLTGCHCMTAKERGQDAVDQKLDLVEGATEALSKRGSGVGRSAAKAVGDTLKGVGSGVKDSLMAPVSTILSEDLEAAGIKVLSANLEEPHKVHVSIRTTHPWKGGLSLLAIGADAGEMGRVVAFEHRELGAEEPVALTFQFDDQVRFSGTSLFILRGLGAKNIGAAAGTPVTLSQLDVTGNVVKTYAVFSKAHEGEIELRAFGDGDQELARFALPPENREADSASFLTFTFPPDAKLAAAKRFELHLKAKSKSRGSK